MLQRNQDRAREVQAMTVGPSEKGSKQIHQTQHGFAIASEDVVNMETKKNSHRIMMRNTSQEMRGDYFV